jgi:peptidoglycan/LPS O-acetylase OafA/YrhL
VVSGSRPSNRHWAGQPAPALPRPSASTSRCLHSIQRKQADEAGNATLRRHRADIDGLRAVAILPVILFHAGFSVFSGGFIGVDVFFVISGYLITAIIAAEVAENRFSILAFYERRVRRIFPALFTMMTFVYAAAWVLFMRQDFEGLGKSVTAATFFWSNILFYGKTGYFDGPAVMKPLLHTWSLSVEEQFYIVFPPLLMLLAARGSRRIAPTVAALAIISLLISTWAVSHAPTAAFYLPYSRAWELFLGSMLALRVFPELQHRLARETLGLGGLALIGWGIFAFSAQTPFPGLSALFPCVGTALLIHTGSDKADTLAARLLAFMPLVFIGLISYSLYLWHWPLLVFAEYLKIDELSPVESASVLAASIVISIASWKYVEQPFRRRDGAFPRPRLFRWAGVAMTTALGAGLLADLGEGIPARLSAEVARIDAFEDSRSPRQDQCLASEDRWINPRDGCRFGAENAMPRTVVWGDSHADAMIEGIGSVAAEHGQSVQLLAYAGCPPVTGLSQLGAGPHHKCPEYTAAVMDYLTNDHGLRNVILLWRQSAYVDGFNLDFGPAEGGPSPLVTRAGSGMLDPELRKKVYAEQIAVTVRALLDAGKHVTLAYPIPETGYDIPSTLARLAARGMDPASFARPFAYYQQRHEFVFEVLDGLGTPDRISRVYPHELLCDDAACITWREGAPLYYDDDHVSQPGARYLAELFAPLFATPRVMIVHTSRGVR